MKTKKSIHQDDPKRTSTDQPSKSAHTTGPWTLEEATGKYIIVDDCPNTIAILDDGMYASASSMTANARLIAAAPDLLAAAKLAQTIRYHQIGLADALTTINTGGRTTTVESYQVARTNAKNAREGIAAANRALDAAIAKAEAR